ncbi:MAG: 3,4-dihydroxy-2-butanone-4-phosphate synthase [Thermoplasmatales archaeon]|nr:3,4-dihydroxy-2-butanone-4-phosphate synthase [Thermoplasmatales archaeon]
MAVKDALEAIKRGEIVLVFDFDDREGETDMTIASEFITPGHITRMRKDAGGLLCTTTPFAAAKEIGLPFMSDVFWDGSGKYPLLAAMAPTDIPYDRTKSSFGVTINHRKTFTGITDRDRALTITEYAETLFSGKPAEEIRREMGERFRAPGHVHLLNTSERILDGRKGHTELCTALMIMAGVKPSATICEMMADDGNALKKDEAMEYAKEHGLVFVEGKDVVDAWAAWKKKG